MTVSAILINLAALITMGLGCLGLFAPDRALKLVGLRLDPDIPHSVAEVRATYGGLFVGLGAAVLWLQSEAGFLLLMTGWFGAALGRLTSVAVDKTGTGQNFGAVAFEAGFGALILIGLLLR